MKAAELSAITAGLKSCPFCGDKPKLEPMPDNSGWWRVRCSNFECGAKMWAQTEPQKAGEVWNKRQVVDSIN